jgi:hypothetical protein
VAKSWDSKTRKNHREPQLQMLLTETCTEPQPTQTRLRTHDHKHQSPYVHARTTAKGKLAECIVCCRSMCYAANASAASASTAHDAHTTYTASS